MPTSPSSRKRLSRAERREVIAQAAMALFAERGYHGTAVDEVARRAGVTPPVVYDHFASKAALHLALLERTRDELLELWQAHLGGAGDLEAQVHAAFVAWASYVRTHPYAPRMFFRETTGVPEIQAAHAEIAGAGGEVLTRLVQGALGEDAMAPMVSEIVRGGLTELAIWWARHPEVDPDEIVAAAMSTVWLGLDRAGRGERWGR